MIRMKSAKNNTHSRKHYCAAKERLHCNRIRTTRFDIVALGIYRKESMSMDTAYQKPLSLKAPL